MDNNTLTQCVLMQHGLTVYEKNQIGTCCYNRTNPSTYKDYTIDPVGCHTCVDQEHAGIKSYRQGANEKYGLDHTHRNPIVLDIIPNRNCNLACKICNEDSSSSWAKLKGLKLNKSYNISINSFTNLLDRYDFSHVQEINFSGGEPFLNNNIVRYVSTFDNRVDFSQCTLRFSTNGSFKPGKQILDFFQKFSLVLARFSLDDVEQGHEYQRWPSRWKEWQTNWQYFVDNAPHNVMMSINRTVSVLNINRLHLLDQWHQQYQQSKFNDPIERIDHFAFGDYSLDYITQQIKDHILHKHGNTSLAWQYIKNRRPCADTGKLQRVITEHDALQGTSLLTFDPELHKLIFL